MYWSYPYTMPGMEASISQRRPERRFSEDLMQANVGRRITVYLTYDGSQQWRDLTFSGVLRQVGRDYFMIREQNSGRDMMFLNINLDYVVFEDEPARLADK
ncbi:spore coat protein GerQ [Laceyella putida]|uniref:Spore coat protein GerQ n=1 Tax=Laceyella putida TaxID=110101 RepID=A0ABW2RJI9_9BACL